MNLTALEAAVVFQLGAQVIASSVLGSVESLIVTAVPDGVTQGTIVI